MVKKLQKNKSSKAELKGKVKDSAQQIWQAGLGAFTKAQAEGAKAIESLVKDSVSIQRKTKAAAEEKISEATNKMSHMATDISSKASGQWDKLENIFEERVAKALNKLGVPSAKDVNALIARIDDLNKAVQKLSTKAPAPKAAPVKAATPKAAAPKVAAPKAKPVTPKATPKAAAKRAAPKKKATPTATVETTSAQQA
ncbi:MAG: phasin family protein [Undibacterium sp.]|uniref:phasin family protein n=1 Tax=Undibacterium sp. TaxID=1914977 RepID=UPI00272620BD|nr:phasin family protein [Undibacterium sp.]MDO8652490.1 phasin family protein [Undibacterium sp.]